jgi:hypothetical protein
MHRHRCPDCNKRFGCPAPFCKGIEKIGMRMTCDDCALAKASPAHLERLARNQELFDSVMEGYANTTGNKRKRVARTRRKAPLRPTEAM